MEQAFVSPAPILRRTTFLQSSPTCVTTTMTLPPVAAQAARLFTTISAKFPFRSRKIPHEYQTILETTNILPNLRAKVISKKPVSAANDHVQLTIEIPPGLTHKLPGQFIQIGRLIRSKACLAVIASPPGSHHLEFLFARGADPCNFLNAKIGEELAVSPVMGDGLQFDHLQSSSGDLFAFADSPQGFAALKSLIEWGRFRAITGEGANRTNFITIYYSLPGLLSIPFADRLSSWSVYGVNVVPLPGSTLSEYLSAKAAVGRPKKNLDVDFVVTCVAKEETFETLFCTLVLCGFRRKSIQKFTEMDVLLQSQDMFEAEDVRDSFEQEVWASWVNVREGMRAEFEKKWATKSRQERDDTRRRKEKEQAWASWSARNKEQWTRVQWDDQAWGRYWTAWESTNEKWAGDSKSAWRQEAKKRQNQWNQQSSQEYWDWVGRGTQQKKAGGGGANYSSYSEQYHGSTGWGNANNQWRGWEKGGYKYEYEEPKEKKKTYNNQQYHQETSSGTGWSGWNHSSQNGKRTSSGNTRNWSNIGKQEIDFYGVLGISVGASKSEIKKAYRKKAMQHHPDRNPDNLEEAHVKMKQIVVAWTVLKDDEKRRRYDVYGSNGL